MKKSFFMTTLLVAGLSLVLCGYVSFRVKALGESVHMDDLWRITEYIERSAQAAGIPESSIRFLNDKPIMACIDGSLFGKTADGTLQLDEDFLIRSVHFYSAELEYDEALQLFTAMYGEPAAWGEDPDVEINGEAALWHRFNTGKYIVTLYTAGDYDYINIELTT